MRCLVTAGPTFESLDQVRRLTNFSTGRLGTELACRLAGLGHEVSLLRGEMAVWSPAAAVQAGVRVVSFQSTADLRTALQGHAGEDVAAVFHAAAVADFTFGRVWRREPTGDLVEVRAGKLSTREGPLLAELAPTPKIIAELRAWFPRTWLVGWKYEVDGGRDAALEAGRAQLRDCRTDLCVVNGPAYGPGFGLLAAEGDLAHVDSTDDLFAALISGVSR